MCSVIFQEAKAMLYHAHQSSILNGGRMTQAETCAHQDSDFNIMLTILN